MLLIVICYYALGAALTLVVLWRTRRNSCRNLTLWRWERDIRRRNTLRSSRETLLERLAEKAECRLRAITAENDPYYVPYYFLSAYGLWLKNGNRGSEEDFLKSLKAGEENE
jgi:hypothetical protein